MQLTVTARRALTADVEEFTLAMADGSVLPAVDAGAHISIETPSGAKRRYSIVHPGQDLRAYTIAIKREAQSRGGSASMHDDAQVGQVLNVDAPDNEFPLGRQGPVLLIAGGIGVTPIYAMAQTLAAEQRPFRVIYCTREAELTPYAQEMQVCCGERFSLHHDHGDPDQVFDFWDLLMTPTAEHIYCCGPSPLMEEVKGVTGHWPEGRVHFEEFKPVDVVRADDHAFTITLARSQTQIEVAADQTILEALRAHGRPAPSSCESGTCGTCKCRYTEGEVDHRDLALMDEEKASHLMLCVSRAKGQHLVLDL